MNNLQKAADKLKTSWCAGDYRQELPKGESFCGIGALAWALSDESYKLPIEFGQSYEEFTKCIDKAEQSPEVKVLAEVIAEYYGDKKVLAGKTVRDIVDKGNYSGAVITFNDDIAESADEVVEMFEKAAVKFDEEVR